MTATGTIYALIDPRDGSTRYIGQTKKQPISKRLTGGYAPRVRAWLAELREAGLTPRIIPVRESVPVSDLLTAEGEEIAGAITAGANLLNEQVTPLGRKLKQQRRETEQAAADRAAWAELAGAALSLLGGPMPPGELPLVEIPDVSWRFMSAVEPGRAEYMRSLLGSGQPRETLDQRHAAWRAMQREEKEAEDQLWNRARGAWGDACHVGRDSFGEDMQRNFRIATGMRYASREDASRFLSLAAWYMTAVDPWRHLAELSGQATDDAAFIAWAGRDPGVREALEFLAARGEGVLAKLARTWDQPWRDKGPGRLLGVIAAAYSGVLPAVAICSDVVEILGKLADDHMLTQPMADLLLRLNPGVLNDVFGKDVAAELDHDLGLAEGTSGLVLRALVGRFSRPVDPAVRRAADRSAQSLPVTALPDYRSWSGPSVVGARVVSASLVRAGLARPVGVTAEEYLAEVRTLWTPDIEWLKRHAEEDAA